MAPAQPDREAPAPPALDAAAIDRLLPAQPQAAAAQLLDAARAGHAEAQAWLGQLYLDGRGVAHEPAEALYWFQRSAHAGVPMAMNMVGRCYENGWGAAVDFVLAAVWYRRGAEAGLDWAVYNYAQMLANGRGVAKDRVQARHAFERAVAMGHARAMHFLGQFHEYGWDVPVDRAKADALYQRSAAGGDYRGLCSWASVLVERGQIEAAVPLLERANQDAPAYYRQALLAQLRSSPHPALKRLAEQLASIWPHALTSP